MAVAARADEQKQWFGATPPDLTIIARARGEAGNAGAGADWLYTYLRSFYRDENRPTGWNNVVFENVGMPHVLYGLQGQQVLNHETHKLELAVPGNWRRPNTTRRFPTWSASWSGWASRNRNSAAPWASLSWPSWHSSSSCPTP
jgi:cytochrome c1